MEWTVILEDESKAEIESLGEEFVSSIIADSSFNSTFRLIKYLDPFGDTVFNRLQMDDLISDLKKLKQIQGNERIEAIIDLALKCKSEQHTYLAFYGD